MDRRGRQPVPRPLVLRLAIVSDTHLPRGARRLSTACLEVLEGADRILHAGDFVAASVLAELQRFAPVEAVVGNMDDADLRAELPERRVVELAGTRIGIVHDSGPRSGRSERLVAAFPGCNAVVYGHTHEPEISRHAGVVILNPGSPTERRRAEARTVIEAELERGRIDAELRIV